MDRRIARVALWWLRVPLAVIAAVLLVAIVALMEPYFTYGLSLGQGPVEAFRRLVFPNVWYSVGFWNHVAAFGLSAVALLAVEVIRRSPWLSGVSGDGGGR